MNDKIDLSKITDVKELKSLAWDQLGVLENAKANLGAINQRMGQLNAPLGADEPKGEVVAD